MKKKAPKDEQLPPIRVDSKLKRDLEREAVADGRDLTNYIRHLLTTDPRRKKK